MDVEIDDGDARKAVAGLRVAGGYGGIIEEAEAHRARGLGMMAGRPRGDKRVDGTFAHNLVDRVDGAADGAQCGLEGAVRHRGVGVEVDQALFRRRVADLLDVVHRMAQRDRLERGRRRQYARERLKLFRFERTLDGAEPVRPLGMARWREVIETGRMGNQERGHYNVSAGITNLLGQNRIGADDARPAFYHRAFKARAPGQQGSRQKSARAQGEGRDRH